MTNQECVQQVIERHRDARQWDDAVVAGAVLAALGLDPMADVHAAAEALALVEKAKAPGVVAEPTPVDVEPEPVEPEPVAEAEAPAEPAEPMATEEPMA